MPQSPRVYEKYFQKSNVFLFPLLDLKRDGRGTFAPVQTYLALPGLYEPGDGRLIVSFRHDDLLNPVQQTAWQEFQIQHLCSHPMYETGPLEGTARERTLFVFDLRSHAFAEDLVHFRAGRYSLLSPAFKQKLNAHYGVQSPNWAAIEALLYPDKGVPLYAAHFGVDERDLREANQGELCPRYDLEQETCPVELSPDFVDAARQL